MARPLRIQAAGLTYHVCSRGTGQMTIYRDDRDRRRFLRMLSRTFTKFSVYCCAYCLMSNHYHLVATTTEANLSKTVQHLNSTYGQWWNRRHRRVGHVFQGRFNAKVIQEETYLLTACRYVVLNPVRAQMVSGPERWQWSSYRATAGLAPLPDFLCPEVILRRFCADDGRRAINEYRKFIGDPNAHFLRLPSGPVLGDETFVEGFRARARRAGREVPGRERRLRETLDVFFAGTITRRERNSQIVEAHRHGHMMTAIARYLDVHYSTVSKVIKTHA
jgi:putative transposase